MPKLRIAEVIDNNNTDSQDGSVQIYIAFLHHGISSDLYPWARSARHATSYIPEIGDFIWIYFEDEVYYKSAFYLSEVDFKDNHRHNETIENMESEYPDVKYVGFGNGVNIALSSNPDTPEVVVNHPSGSRIYIDKDGQTFVTATKQLIVDDDNGNEIVVDSAGINVLDANGNEIDMISSGTTITDANGNEIEMGSSSVLINGNFEVLQ